MSLPLPEIFSVKQLEMAQAAIGALNTINPFTLPSIEARTKEPGVPDRYDRALNKKKENRIPIEEERWLHFIAKCYIQELMDSLDTALNKVYSANEIEKARETLLAFASIHDKANVIIPLTECFLVAQGFDFQRVLQAKRDGTITEEDEQSLQHLTREYRKQIISLLLFTS